MSTPSLKPIEFKKKTLVGKDIMVKLFQNCL